MSKDSKCNGGEALGFGPGFSIVCETRRGLGLMWRGRISYDKDVSVWTLTFGFLEDAEGALKKLLDQLDNVLAELADPDFHLLPAASG